MTKFVALFFWCYCTPLSSQNKVGYSYDLNGNRIQRYFIGLRHADQENPADSLLNVPLAGPAETGPPKTPETLARERGIKVYPNPTRDLVMVTIATDAVIESRAAEMYLIDNSGRVLETKKYTGADLSFDLAKSPPGNYYLKIIFDAKETLVYNVVKVD